MAEMPKQQKKIQIIDDPVEAVRKLPDVYIGALGNAGFLNMYREIVQNSLDEIIKGNTLDKNIIISFDERSHTCIIEDNGQGIEINMLVPVFSVLHSSSNYDKKEGSGEYSSGKNGMGATITNYLSKFFIVESYRPDGSAGKVEFEEGRINSKGLQTIKSKKDKHGLITSFCPSSMMGQITVTVDEIQNLTWLITHLCRPGTRVLFNAIDSMGRTRKVIIENKNDIDNQKGQLHHTQRDGLTEEEQHFIPVNNGIGKRQNYKTVNERHKSRLFKILFKLLKELRP